MFPLSCSVLLLMQGLTDAIQKMLFSLQTFSVKLMLFPFLFWCFHLYNNGSYFFYLMEEQYLFQIFSVCIAAFALAPVVLILRAIILYSSVSIPTAAFPLSSFVLLTHMTVMILNLLLLPFPMAALWQPNLAFCSKKNNLQKIRWVAKWWEILRCSTLLPLSCNLRALCLAQELYIFFKWKIEKDRNDSSPFCHI